MFTKIIFFLSYASTGYLFIRLWRKQSLGPSIRYAIGTTIVFWNTIEILAKWGAFQEPWLLLNPGTIFFFFGGTAVGVWMVIRELRNPTADSLSA